MPYENLRHPLLSFFGNREVSSLYTMLGLLEFAGALVGVFIPVFLWQIGYALWEIVLFFLLRSAWFLAFAFLFLPLFRRISDKLMMLLGMPFLVLLFLGLSRLERQELLFWLLPAAWGLFMLLFWVGFHLNFAAVADEGRFGREVGLRNLFMNLAAFAGPIAGGFLISLLGFSNVFLLGSVLLLAAVPPLFFFPKRKMPSGLRARAVFRHLADPRTRPYSLSAAGFAMEMMIPWIVWPIFVFLAVGDIERFGILYSAGLLLGVIVTALTGELTDNGKGKRVLAVAAPLYSLVWAARAFLSGTGPIVASHVAGDAVYNALRVPWGSLYYRIVRKLPDGGIYIFSTEVLFHLVRVAFTAVLMVLAMVMPESAFFRASFLLAAAASLLFLSARRQSLKVFGS